MVYFCKVTNSLCFGKRQNCLYCTEYRQLWSLTSAFTFTQLFHLHSHKLIMSHNELFIEFDHLICSVQSECTVNINRTRCYSDSVTPEALVWSRTRLSLNNAV